ncbi:hypothetical protein M9Y10_009487 [Tritrichomonas musculus]|uniref:Protein kinase domain-containing protein n=1 Tax=Tritrichomonas musculus TaxID=1915356 RepID=A0ABR2IPD5_9EUKA
MSNQNAETNDISKYIIDHNQLKFERVIGMGGYGEVSLGYHIPTGIKVAIKRLFDINESQRMLELYHREIQTLSLVKNIFLLPFIGFTNSPPYCIVTKFIPNGSLYDSLHEVTKPTSPRSNSPSIPPISKGDSKRNSKAMPKSKRRSKNKNIKEDDDDSINQESNSSNYAPHKLSPTQKTFIAYGIAVGMQILHEKGIIHRDLKTQNILIDEHNCPIISDFGSSRYANGNAPKTSSFGTSNYMAPEFIQGDEYDLPVDVYSYGMILWEMLTEEVPFLGKESAQVIYMVVIQQSRPPIPENTPNNLKKLIEKCWSPDQFERPTFEKIVSFFTSRKVEFPGTDQDELNHLFQNYRSKNNSPIKRRHSDVSPRDSYNSDVEMMNNIQLNDDIISKSVSTFISKSSRSSPKQQTIDDSLSALDEDDPIKIKQSVEFFESIMNDKIILQIDLWPHFLNFLLRQYNSGANDDLSIFIDNSNDSKLPLDLIQRVEALVKYFASTYEILEGIKKLNDLQQFLLPNDTFLSLFLYIVNFLPGVVDDQIVKRIFQLFGDNRYSFRAATLVCRIVQNSPQPNLQQYILDMLQKNVSNFVELSGGHLIIELLLHYKYLKINVISMFNRSTIDENVISSYKSLFSINGPPELFSLQNILQHCLSANEELRDLSLEFIRRFAFGAEREPLMLIVTTLFKVIFNYESEKAALLLIRVSSDPKRCISLINAGFINDFLDAKPSTALLLLKIFLTIIVANEKCKKFFFQHPLIGKYFTNVAKNYDEDAIISLCWSLNQIQVTADLAVNLTKNEFISILCDIITSPRSSKILSNSVSKNASKFRCNVDHNLSRHMAVESDDDYDDGENDAFSSMSSTSSANPYGLILDPNRLTWFLSAIAKVAPFADCDRYNKVVRLLFDLIDKKSIKSRNCLITLCALSHQKSTHDTFISNNIFALFNRYNDNSEETKNYQKQILKNIRDGGKFLIP